MEHKQKFLIFSFLLIFFTQYCVNLASSDLHQQKSGQHFVLVHGASHGAWCWYKIVPLLRSLGHNVTALDLAASGINPKQALDVPLISEYFSPLTEFMASLPPQERVILVGHSFGGFAITYAMEKFPDKISVAIFAAAAMLGPLIDILPDLPPEVFRNHCDTLDSTGTFDNGPNNPPNTTLFTPEFMEEKLYQLSPIEDWTMATLLVRPLYCYTIEDLLSTVKPTRKNYGSVNRVYIMTGDDKLFSKFAQVLMIGLNPPSEVREITGSDHMVMMSKPTELFAQLEDISQRYSSGEYMLK